MRARRWCVRDGVVKCVVGPLFVGLSWVRIVRACVLSWVEILTVSEGLRVRRLRLYQTLASG